MKTKILGAGSASLEVSIVGFGAMGLTAFYDPVPTEQQGLKILQTAFNSGVRHFDTAQCYFRENLAGEIKHNEALLGKFLATLSPEEKKIVTVATKFMPVDRSGNPAQVFDEDYFIKKCNESLERLGISCIDLYYSHRIYPKCVPVQHWMDGFVKLIQTGKIKRIGLSEASANVIRSAHAIHSITCVQQEWSLFVRDLEEEIVPLCQKLGIGIVAYSPIGRGFLGGKFDAGCPRDWRSSIPYMQEKNLKQNKKLLQEIKLFASEKNVSTSRLCLAWLIAKGAVPIPGSTKRLHIEDNCLAAEVKLTNEEIKYLDEFGSRVQGLRASPKYLRKFEQPRSGHLGFLPRKRCTRSKGKVKSFPVDDASKEPHLTAFMAYKAGMTHIVRDVDKTGSKLHKKEVVEAVTVLEAPAMVVVGVVGYLPTPNGLKTIGTVWAQHLGEEFKRRLYRRYFASKKKAFTKYAKKWDSEEGKKSIEEELARLEKFATVIRVIAHTQMKPLNIGQKKAHVMEIQVNGGSIGDKIKFAKDLFEKEVPIDSVFEKDEMIDTIGITKGKGFEGVVTRWGVTRLPRKTHKGLRKVACIGSWHPSRVRYTVARAGQNGYHHRTEKNKKVYKIGKKGDDKSCMTEVDLTEKSITPMGGFPHYGNVTDDWIMLKGCVTGVKRRVITLRKSLCHPQTREALEKINLKFIDTSSKNGHGRFQTSKEKERFFGPRKN
eukprot:augustus_masked-scaffold_16-processed-gene-5.1-mRNA-1 protein AED:0.10 eAED:0.10 QI:0/0/0/1/1/1/2/0/713